MQRVWSRKQTDCGVYVTVQHEQRCAVARNQTHKAGHCSLEGGAPKANPIVIQASSNNTAGRAIKQRWRGAGYAWLDRVVTARIW